MQCGHAVSAHSIFPCHSEVQRATFLLLLRLQASSPEPKSGSYCTITFNQAVSCWLCTIAETVGLSPAATPGAPFIPMGKDAMTPWIFFHHDHYSTINSIMLQDFSVGLWFRRLQKRFHKMRFFLHCIQDSPISSFHLQKSGSTPQFSGSYLPSVKDTCLFLTYAGEILLLPLSTILDTYLRFLTTSGGPQREKRPFSTPYGSCCPLSSAGSLVTITGGPYSIGQGNRQSRRHRPRAPQEFT